MNIFGEGFPKEIVDQIDTRQSVYGYGWNQDGSFSRTNASILYSNANTSWCKLVSAANVYNYSLLNNSNISSFYPSNDDSLARNYVLFNGTSQNDNPNNRSGIGSFDNNKAYTSWGTPSTDFGFRPMAGIQSVTVKHKNRGSIRTAAVNIKAWDKVSFEIIDLLYLRLGFSVLLEWGHAEYYDNNGVYRTGNDINNSLSDEFLDAKLDYNSFLKRIQKQRLSSCGNYDAMFGKVTNFHWSFNKDGSYDITVDLVSIGDVIESFKIKGNALAASGSSTNTGEKVTKVDFDSTSNTTSIIEAYGKTSDIAEYLYNITYILTNGFYYIGGPSSLNNVTYNNVKPENSPFDQNPSNGPTDVVRTVNSSNDSNTNYDEFYYIRLGNLLKVIQDNIMYQVTGKGGTNPILFFDTDINSNIMHVPDQLMSYDPNICMVRRTVEFPSANGIEIPSREYFAIAQETDRTISSTNKETNAELFMHPSLDEVGRIMNIYVNFRFILSKLQTLTDKDTNELKLIDFLKEILSGINSAFGGYSKLDLFIDETNNTVKIIDQNPLPSKTKALNTVSGSTNYALFELYGYAQREDPKTKQPTPNRTTTFIRDFKFNTELTPEFSTMISVAATSRGNVVGENNTALSKLNLGVEDKYKTAINGGGKVLNSNKKNIDEQRLEEFQQAASEYYSFATRFKTYLDHLYVAIFLKQEIEDNKGTLTIYLKLYKKYMNALEAYESCDAATNTQKNITKFQPGTGFIPFNLSITTDGLSGMKIGSKFLIDGSYLPSNYPETVDFLIKNMVHEIKDNKWTTTLESYCISQGSDSYTPKRIELPSPPPTPPTTNPISVPNTSLQKSTKTLKQIIIDAGYAEGTPEFVFAYSIGTKEGWNPKANGGKGSRSYRNNNPGNLDYSNGFKSIDPKVALENNPYGSNRFAQFTTAELGVKALVEYKIKRWANGNMPVTLGNQDLIVRSKGGTKYIKGTSPTLAQFVYTYAPPNENNTENYLNSIIKDLLKIKSDTTRTTFISKFFK